MNEILKYKNSVIILICYCFIFGLLHFIFNYYLFGYNPIVTLQKLSYDNSIVDNPFFWNSPIGITLKVLIEILITSLLLYSGVIIHKLSLKLGQILIVVILCHTVFLVEFLIDFIYLFTNKSTKINLNEFSLGSLFSLTKLLGITSLNSLSFILETFSIFELIYCILISYFFSKITERTFKESLKLVLGYYALPLLLWAVAISFMSIMLIN